jgi:hypothetical protein
MANSKRRLDKLEVSLTPKQTILLWMEEAHQYDTMEQYVRSLKPGPDSAWPLCLLPEKVSTAVEQVVKGRPRQEVAAGTVRPSGTCCSSFTSTSR